MRCYCYNENKEVNDIMKLRSILSAVTVATILISSVLSCVQKDNEHDVNTTSEKEVTEVITTTGGDNSDPEPDKTGMIYTGSGLYPFRISFDGIPDGEPYSPVSGGGFDNETVKWSPDPLVSYRYDSVNANDDLQVFSAFPVAYKTDDNDSFENAGSVLTDDTCITVKGNGDIIFDFGVEFAGWLEIDSPDLPGTKSLKLSVSEYSLPEIVNAGPQSPEKTGYPKKVTGNTYRLELNSELYEGVRYGFIHVEDFKKEFRITAVRLICQVKPANYNGSFSSDNELLNRIWYTAAYDVRVNLKKDYIAAILVDRGDRHSWTGDAYTSQAAALAAFANYDFVLENLKYTSVRPNGIESYELYWVLSLLDYYNFTGDRGGVRPLLSAATKRLDHAYSVWGKNPSLSFFGWDERLGAGFENPDVSENQISYKVLAIECWNKFSEVLDDFGYDSIAEKYRGYAREKTEEMLSDPAWYDEFGMHAFADAVNAGIVSDDVQDLLFDKYFTDRVNRISYSPFNEYFILKALSSMGKYDDAISSILDLWGGQVEYGGTCFFETFRPEWIGEIDTNAAVPNNQAGYTSLAHPWSAGVLAWMSAELLGIKPVDPGFKCFSVVPHLGTQLNNVSGKMSTPYGTIDVGFDITSGKHSVTIPEGTTALIAIPKAGRTVSGLMMNGKPAAADREDTDYFYFENLTPGKYEFSAEYSGAVEKYNAPERVYDAEFIGADEVTKGSWKGVYGSEGYYICGSGSVNANVLPDYVSGIVLTKGVDLSVKEKSSDPRAVQIDLEGTAGRTVTQYATNYNNACYQTFTVDINLVCRHKYTVALYFVDWDGGRSLAVEMFDGDTLEMIAPVKTLHDYTGGVYLVYEYDGSARFRIDHIRGDYVSLSGIFFGTGEPSYGKTSHKMTDNTDPSISYVGSGWHHDPMDNAYNGTFSYSNVKGDSAEFVFEGDNIAIVTSREQNRGVCEVFIDGVSEGKIDLYSSRIRRQEKVFFKELEYGVHTVKVTVTGEKNKYAADCYVEIDAFDIKTAPSEFERILLDDRDVSVAYSGNWTHDPISDAYLRTFSYSNEKGDYAEIRFEGNAVSLISSLENNRGIAEIYLDGVSKGEIDLYSQTVKRQQTVFFSGELTEGEHVLRIVVKGEKNGNASACYVDIDAFEITCRNTVQY